jgi:hypothetical protein
MQIRLGRPSLVVAPAREARVVEIVLPPRSKPIPVVRVPALGLAMRDPTLPKQVTVLDHTDEGAPYIRSYVERHMVSPDDPYYTYYRSSSILFCATKLSHDIALEACHHYCRAPCQAHLDKLTRDGWTRASVGDKPVVPPSALLKGSRRLSVPKEGEEEE